MPEDKRNSIEEYYSFFLGNPFADFVVAPNISGKELLSYVEGLDEGNWIFWTYCAYFHELYRNREYDRIRKLLQSPIYREALAEVKNSQMFDGFIKDFGKFTNFDFFKERFDMYGRFMKRHAIIIGNSDAIKKLKAEIFTSIFGDNILFDFSPDDCPPNPVLLLGPTGSGKELVADLIAYTLAGDKKDYIYSINIAQLPENLIESELFGHKKGSFSGALSDRTGVFDRAEPVIFLDEIGHFNEYRKLLRVIEYGEYRRVGDDEIREHDKYIIAATAKPLDDPEWRAERGLEEFYQRFSVVKIPPLREHKEDIPDILRAHPELKFTEDMIEEFMQSYADYDFPGNIRELIGEAKKFKKKFNPIKQIFIGHTSDNSVQDPPSDFNFDGVISRARKLEVSLDDLILSYTRYVFEKVNRNRAQACKILNIAYNTLTKHLKKAGIDIAQSKNRGKHDEGD